MDQVFVVRHKVLVEGRSVRRVAREMGISRNTVRRYVDGAEPGRRRPAARARPVFERVRERVEAILEASTKDTTRKQRMTAAQVHRMLAAEGVECGETLVKKLVREWRRKRREVFVPLVYAPGDLAEIDFFEATVRLAGVAVKVWMFLMRLMASGREFAWLYERQDQVSLLDGCVRAFEHFGAVPHRLLFDNPKTAVTRILVGSERQLHPRYRALSTHYLFEPCFARPGTGHDKGGVESRGRAVRLAHLTPMPHGSDLEEISAALVARLDAEVARRRRDGDDRTMLERFEQDERPRMLPLPATRFDVARHASVSLSRRSLAKIEGAYYSAPCAWAGLRIDAHVGPRDVVLVGPGGERVTHPRKRLGGRAIDYRHYLPELAKKPQAVRQVAGELVPQLGAPFDRVWRELVDAHGPKDAARVFARVLDAVVALGAKEAAERLESALARGESITLALALARRRREDASSLAELPPVVRDVHVESASAADYDALLGAAAGGAR